MKRFRFLAVVAALALGGCTALDQFPDRSNDYSADLIKLDCDYAIALAKINGEPLRPEEMICAAETGATDSGSTATTSTATGSTGTANTKVSEDEQVRIRNSEIDKRLAVIDANFENFRIALSQENVKADFGVSLVEVGVGGAGALVAETASQILSAVSGGLAGAQAAYSKAALYEKALSALLAQMIASRKAVLVRILEGRKARYDDYPLSVAVHDLDAYYFAGSLPGAIVATSADAKVKDVQAEEDIEKVLTIRRDENFLAEDAVARVNLIVATIQGLSDGDAIALSKNPPTQDTNSEQVVSMQDRNNRRFTDGDAARTTLVTRARTDARTVGNLTEWERALGL